MQLRFDQLERHLGGALARAYVIASDEPLLAQEARDLVVAAARRAGIGERLLFQVDAQFDWARFGVQSQTLSLFAERRLLDVRLPGAADAAALEALARSAAAGADDVLLVSMPGVDRRAEARPAFKALSVAGVYVRIYPVREQELPAWVVARARRAGVRLDAAAADLLCERVEGNLLAAAQQIDLLSLLAAGRSLDAAQLGAIIEDVSRFENFALFDAAVAGDARRVLHVLAALRVAGEAPLATAGAFAFQVRRLLAMAEAVAGGMAPGAAVAAARVFGRERVAACTRVLGWLAPGSCLALLERLARCDQQVKGMQRGDPWLTLSEAALALARCLKPTPAAWLRAARIERP
jgi:DNA polymerase-3 subunit delta